MIQFAVVRLISWVSYDDSPWSYSGVHGTMKTALMWPTVTWTYRCRDQRTPGLPLGSHHDRCASMMSREIQARTPAPESGLKNPGKLDTKRDILTRK